MGGLAAPTHSDTVSLQSFSLQPDTKTYITFLPEKFEFLKTRGYFGRTQYCQDDIDFTDTVKCKKRCMLKNLKVKRLNFVCESNSRTSLQIECQPSEVNVFDGLDLPKCPPEEEVTVFRSLMSNSLFPIFECGECLDPCTYMKYSYRVINQERL